MATGGLRDAIPSVRTLLTIGLSGLLGGVVAIGVTVWLGAFDAPPGPATDPHFVKAGRAYLPELGKAYAAAWEEGARCLDAGQPLTAAITAVGKAWDANRVQLFDRLASPEFIRIIPESSKDADVTPQQRAAMAAAWRGFASGLGR